MFVVNAAGSGERQITFRDMPTNDVIILHDSGRWELRPNPGRWPRLNYAEKQSDGKVKVRPPTKPSK